MKKYAKKKEKKLKAESEKERMAEERLKAEKVRLKAIIHQETRLFSTDIFKAKLSKWKLVLSQWSRHVGCIIVSLIRDDIVMLFVISTYWIINEYTLLNFNWQGSVIYSVSTVACVKKPTAELYMSSLSHIY